MKIGVPKEIKIHEARVGLVPASVRELVLQGHQVFVEAELGQGSLFSDADYRSAGAVILETARQVFQQADLIVKVKELQPSEYQLLKTGQILFAFLHLAPDLSQVKALLQSGCSAIAYETVTDRLGRLPLLLPMSEIAGRLSIQVGAHCLERPQGGRGVLLSGVPGVRPGDVLVIGGGVVGVNAIQMALACGAQVTVIDKSVERLQALDLQFGAKLNTVEATKAAIEENMLRADLVIGAVLVPGRTAPKLVSSELVKRMRPGAVIVDVAIDQGGCFETSKPTSHAKPTFIVDDVVHYCVTNMPSAVPKTASLALNHATLPFISALANKGLQALLDDAFFLQGLNVCQGKIVHQAIAADLNMNYTPAREALTPALLENKKC